MAAVGRRFETELHGPDTKILKLLPSSTTSSIKLETGKPTLSSSHSRCVGCNANIYDPFILHVQPDLDWHDRCLNCYACRRPLVNDSTCFVRNRKAYCREDYLHTFLGRCWGCRQVIDKSDLVFRVKSFTFHLDCFRCTTCQRLLRPGEEIVLQDDQIKCLLHNSNTDQVEMGVINQRCELLIKHDPIAHSSTSTSAYLNGPGCSPVSSTDDASLGHQLHSSVGRPEVSTTTLGSQFANDEVEGGTLELRRRDRCRNTSSGPLSKSDQISSTSPPYRQLTSPGSSSPLLAFGLTDEIGTPSTVSSEISHDEDCSSLLGYASTNNSHNHQAPPTGRPGALGRSNMAHQQSSNNRSFNATRHRSSAGSSNSGGSSSGGANGGDEVVHSLIVCRSTLSSGGRMNGSRMGGGGKRSKEQKTTRVRTVLNEKQLHTLRSCYAANPRPDALMKEQLVEMTSLSPRVIRVWFQNKRCKDKKRQILLKQMEQQQQQNGGRPGALQGISMIADSPIRNDISLLSTSSGIDIQRISAPYWKSDAGLVNGYHRSGSPNNPRSHSPGVNAGSTYPSSSIDHQHHCQEVLLHRPNGDFQSPPPPIANGYGHSLTSNCLVTSLGSSTTIGQPRPPRFTTDQVTSGGMLDDNQHQHQMTSIPPFQQLMTNFDNGSLLSQNLVPSNCSYAMDDDKASFGGRTTDYFPTSESILVPNGEVDDDQHGTCLLQPTTSKTSNHFLGLIDPDRGGLSRHGTLTSTNGFQLFHQSQQPNSPPNSSVLGPTLDTYSAPSFGQQSSSSGQQRASLST